MYQFCIKIVLMYQFCIKIVLMYQFCIKIVLMYQFCIKIVFTVHVLITKAHLLYMYQECGYRLMHSSRSLNNQQTCLSAVTGLDYVLCLSVSLYEI